jgi:TonB family protein
VKKYVDRIKQTVGRIWKAKIEKATAEADPKGRCLCSDRRTIVEFTVDRSGAIRDVVVTHSSGVTFLDRVSVEAFNEVRQVEGPPPAIFGEKATAVMGFGFTLGLGRGARSTSCTSDEGP